MGTSGETSANTIAFSGKWKWSGTLAAAVCLCQPLLYPVNRQVKAVSLYLCYIPKHIFHMYKDRTYLNCSIGKLMRYAN